MAGRGGFPRPIVYFFVGLILLNVLSRLASDSDFAEDLPFFLAIGAFILFRVFSSQSEKKRGPVPMPRPMPETQTEQPKDLGSKIPTLKGAPRDAQAEAQEAQKADEDLDALRRDSYERHLAAKQEREQKMEEERLRREHQTRAIQTATPDARRFSPDALRNAVIWSEIIAPPKALRKR